MLVSAIRTILLFLLLTAAMRLMGKRQLGELEPSELVVAVLISDLAAIPMQDPEIPFLAGLVPLLVLFSCEVLISGLLMRNIRLRTVLCGHPSMIIRRGKLQQREMTQCRLTLDELYEALRKQAVLDIQTVDYAVLETDGTLSILLKPEEAPLTPKAVGIAPSGGGYPVLVISTGRVLGDNLSRLGYDRAWLRHQLEAHKVSASEVYLMTADENGQVYLVKKEDA